MSDSDEVDDVDMGEDVATKPVPLEEKYREQMRQIFLQKIELPISTLSGMIKEQIQLSPDFQRREIWKNDRRSRFIESIVMNVPIPPVFLGEDEYGKYVVLDGRQRLTAVNEFLLNGYELEGLRVWTELNGLRYQDLKKKQLEIAVTRRFIPAVLILKESSPEVKYDVFDRLNTGGMIANPMEIRNAIHRGPFIERVHVLSDTEAFRRLWDIPLDNDKRPDSKLYKRMGDLELVLRFFSLEEHQQYLQFNGTFRDYMTHVLIKKNAEYKATPAVAAADAAKFELATKNAWRVFGTDAFRKPDPQGKLGVKSAPLADAVLHSLADVPAARLTNEVATKVRDTILALCKSDGEFRKSIGTGTNGRGATGHRLTRAKVAVAAVI